MNDTDRTLRTSIMEKIGKGKVQMRPRWHFLLLSGLALLGALLLLLLLVYVSSLSIFLVRDTGMWFAPEFGARGWFDFFDALPWLLIILLLVFVVLLQRVVRRFAFVYHKPLVASLLGIVGIIVIVGFILAPLHQPMELSARHGNLPAPLSFLYRAPFRPARPSDLYLGSIVAVVPGGFVLVDENGAGTTTVLITPQTRLPAGAGFAVGEEVVVIGDPAATGTIHAFGVRDTSGK